jgi:hypothetical protein
MVPRSRIFLLPWRWRRYVPPKRRLIQYLHGDTFQKTAFFNFTEFAKWRPLLLNMPHTLRILLESCFETAWISVPNISRDFSRELGFFTHTFPSVYPTDNNHHRHYHCQNRPFWATVFFTKFCQICWFLATFFKFLSPEALTSLSTSPSKFSSGPPYFFCLLVWH